MADGRTDLSELLDGIADLPVQNAPVGHDDDGIETRCVVFRQADQLVRKPGDGVGLPAARGMLNQVALARPVPTRVGEERAHHVELVVTRPDLGPGFAAGFLVLRGEDPCVVFQDVGQAFTGENLPPQVIGFETIGIRWIARAVVPPLVEGQKPGRLAPQVRAEFHLVFIDGEVDHAPAQLEELLAPRITVASILLHRVVRCLLGEGVLQLEGCDRQTIDEQSEVQRKPRLLQAITQLARDREPIRLIACPCRLVAGGRRTEEQIDVTRPVFDALAQDINDAALADLTLQARQELPASRAVFGQGERFDHLGLGLRQKRRKLRQVHTVFAVVIVRIAGDPTDVVGSRPFQRLHSRGVARFTRRAGQGRTNQPFQPAFGSVGGHRWGLTFTLTPTTLSRPASEKQRRGCRQ